MIASVRFEVNNTKDKQKIKGAIDAGGRLEIFDLGIEGIIILFFFPFYDYFYFIIFVSYTFNNFDKCQNSVTAEPIPAPTIDLDE